MSYNFTIERIASEAAEMLPRAIDDAKRTAPPHEFDRIEGTGQMIDLILGDIPDDKLVTIQAYGSETPSVGDSTFFISITAKTVQTSAASADEKAEPWDPSKGPLAVTRRREPAAVPAATTRRAPRARISPTDASSERSD